MSTGSREKGMTENRLTRNHETQGRYPSLNMYQSDEPINERIQFKTPSCDNLGNLDENQLRETSAADLDVNQFHQWLRDWHFSKLCYNHVLPILGVGVKLQLE